MFAKRHLIPIVHYQHEYAKKNLMKTSINQSKNLFDKEQNINVKQYNLVASISDTNERKLIKSTLITSISIPVI